MNITANGKGGYILSFNYESLHKGYITAEYARKLICAALSLSSLPKDTAIDFYEGRDSVLIFVRLPKIFYRFDSFEDVISACKSCSAENASLYYYDEEYILFVSDICAYLSEFSDPEILIEEHELFIREHGKTIIESNAVNFVKNTF